MFNGFYNLLLIALILTITTIAIIGHEKKSDKEKHHPWFGRFTVNMPNLLSYLRFPLAFWIFVVHYFPYFNKPFWIFSYHLAFALVCLFDVLDGKFARKWSAISEDGKSLDPAADKWVTFCLALTALLYGDLWFWVFVIVVLRELIIIVQRKLLIKKGINVSAKWLGKIKTGVQFTVLYIIILRSDVFEPTVGLELIARSFPDGLIFWGVTLLCFCTIISIFPFFQSFSYVNDYPLYKELPGNKPWFITWLPNLFTIGNYLCGVTAVFFAIPLIDVQYRSFVILFWFTAAGFCDALDGPIARKLKSYSDFGASLDSSTDLSTFGLAAAVIIFLRFTAISNRASVLGLFLAVLYFVFVHLRLARFAKHGNEEADKSKKSDFVGLPSPSGAIGVMIFFTFFENIILLTVFIVFLIFLMYSKFDFISHSNSLKSPLYRNILIPSLFIGFGMLFVLIFQQPFVSNNFSRELIVYFRVCSWILFIPLCIYMIDGVRRTYFRTT